MGVVAFTPFPISFPSISHSRSLHSISIGITMIKCVKADADSSSSSPSSIMCESCIGKGWLLCDFCQGQKTNVKAQNNRIYRRCPSCKAVGCVLCSRCKVFKCVTFPDFNDSPITT